MKCKICNQSGIDLVFKYNSDISYYKCPVCKYFSRIPDNYLINYEDDYMSSDFILKSKLLAKNYYRRLNKSIHEKSLCLKVGGSFGFFCKLLQSRKDCVVRNIELSNFASDFANQNAVITFNDLNLLDIKKFDFIFLFHLLEHLQPNELVKYLDNLLKLLNPNGKLIFFTPNADSFKLKILKKYFVWLVPDEHIGFLSKRTLPFIINENDFDFEVKNQIPSFIHYPNNSLFKNIRKLLFKRKVSEFIPVNNQENNEISFKQSIILKLKKIFHLTIIIEKLFIIPFYLLFDLFSSQYDELSVIIQKKI